MAFALLAASAAQGADWRQQLTPPEPGNFPLPRSMNATYQCGWTSFAGGNINLSFSRLKGDQLRLEGTGKSTGLVRSLWRMDFTHVSTVDASSLLPITLRQTEVYPWETERSELNFTPQGVSRLRDPRPQDRGKRRWRVFKFPNLRELHSALLFTRSLPLRQGDTLRMVVYPTTAPYLASVKVVGREPVRVSAGKFNAIKLELNLWRVTGKQNSELLPHSKFKRAYVWLSDDADRLFLKVTADIFVGNVWAELETVKFDAK